MKIFISHSSKDQWAAKRISEDLIKLGAKTFLDEKDIETGQSIDDSIKKHLKECSDFLVLLSPASIKSEWVLIELGGALALEKRIVPILFYVGANEIPQAINLKLSRDINSIHLYYNEIKNVLSGNKVKKTVLSSKPKATFRVGDRVRVISETPQDIQRDDFLIDWETPMSSFLGQETQIVKINPRGVSECYVLANDPDGYIFAKEWLIPIK